MQDIRVVYASDENYVKLTAISAVSVLRCNPGAEIILLGYKLKEEAREIVRSRVVANGGAFSYCDVSPCIAPIAENGCSGYVSYAVYSRIFIPDMVKDDGRLLYLDCDTLVTASLAPLWRLDMQGRPLALGGDCIPMIYGRLIGLPHDVPYFNTGSMLIDLVQWRKKHCKERIMQDLSAPPAPNPLGDQDVIVRSLAGDICPLNPEWNFISQYHMMSYSGLKRVVGCPVFAESAYNYARNGGAVIHHFSGNTFGRPWYVESRHPMREKYREIAHQAGLPEVAEQSMPLSRDYFMQYWLWKLLPGFLFNLTYPFILSSHVRRGYGIR